MSLLDRVIESLPWNRIPTGNRVVFVDHHRVNSDKTFCNNYITTTKYNILNFLPKNLLEQFSRLANVYFLFMALLQLFSGLSPTDRWGTPISLLIVVIFQMLKDAYEDIGRYLSDKVVNSQFTTIMGTEIDKRVYWCDVKVGDVLKIGRDETIPADVVLLATSNSESNCHVETSQLDGETDLKIREAIPIASDLISSGVTPHDLQGVIECEGPSKILYEFVGNIELVDKDEQTKHPIVVENLLLRGSVLKNTEWIMGVVIYTGKHTRVMMNSRELSHKSSKLERITNWFIVSLFVLQTIINLSCAIALLYWNRNHRSMWYVMREYNDPEAIVFIEGFLSYFMLYGQFVPLALYVTLEIARLFQTRLLLEPDIDMYHEETDMPMSAKSTSLTDDLGQVEHIFTDKTGTLTQNRMALLHVSTRDGTIFESISDCASFSKCRKLLHILATCHTVVPERVTDELNYQASSPDELALVNGARSAGVTLYDRNVHSIQVLDNGEIVNYELLHVLNFTYNRKRMSVIVRSPEGKIMLYCKGADSVMLERMAKGEDISSTEEILRCFGKKGLRTLVCAEVELDEKIYQKWNNEWYKPASISIYDKDYKMADAMERIEKNLRLVGITAIEDKLQDGVPETIKILSDAGIKIWVLTGDKQETSIFMGYACSILDYNTSIHYLNTKSQQDLRHMIYMSQNCVLDRKAVVIDGDTVKLLFDTKDHTIKTEFLKLCIQANSVICCRVSPDQKALIVNLVRDTFPQSVTLAIGDGANDVSMIRSANVGVGIIGKDGRQAANASDYAFAQFRFLQKLLLVHGRWNYRRVSKLILFSIYKSIALNCVQLWYFIFNGASGQTIFEPFLLSLFYTIFTGLPIGFYGVLDKDVSVSNIKQFPELYAHGHQNYHLNMRVFLGWTINCFYHSFVCFFIPYFCYGMGKSIHENGYAVDLDGMGLASYTSVILVVTFKLVLETRSFTLLNHLTYWSSCASFFVIAVIYSLIPGRFYYGFINNAQTVVYWLTVILTTIVALLRDFIWKALVRNIQMWRQLYHELQDYDQTNDIASRQLIKQYELKLHSPVRNVVDKRDKLSSKLFWWGDRKDDVELIPSDELLTEMSGVEPGTPVAG